MLALHAESHPLFHPRSFCWVRVSPDLRYIVIRYETRKKPEKPRHACSFLSLKVTPEWTILRDAFLLLFNPVHPTTTVSFHPSCLVLFPEEYELSLSQPYNPEIWARITWNSKLPRTTGGSTRSWCCEPNVYNPRGTRTFVPRVKRRLARLPEKSKSGSELLDFRASEQQTGPQMLSKLFHSAGRVAVEFRRYFRKCQLAAMKSISSYRNL